MLPTAVEEKVRTFQVIKQVIVLSHDDTLAFLGCLKDLLIFSVPQTNVTNRNSGHAEKRY